MTSHSPRFIKVGIAYEGTLDTSYVIALVDRLLSGLGYVTSDPDVVYANTTITKYVPAYVKRFSESNCELMIFLTDGDGGANKRRDIVSKIKSTKPEVMQSCAIGIAEPHLEGWVISDEDAVKAVFDLNPTEPLPHSAMKPKDRLISIYNTSTYSGTFDDAKVTIANCANIETMRKKSSGFDTFLDDIKAVLNQLSV